MIKLSEKAVCEEASMRMVYKALGIRPQTAEAATYARRKKPVGMTRPDSPLKGKKKTANTCEPGGSCPTPFG